MKALLAGVLLALSSAAVALADNPTVRITKEDQAKAEAALFKVADFGAGWKGGPKTPDKLTSPNCPGFDPKESDLTVTGHAEAQFTLPHYGIAVGQDTQVLQSADDVTSDFSRSITSKLPDCLAYQLKSGSKGQITNVAIHPLTLQSAGDHFASYRAVISININGRRSKFIRDFVFMGVGRFEFSIFVDGPMQDGTQLVPFEQALVRKLVHRTTGGNVA